MSTARAGEGDKKYFYDVHCHVQTLSHPCLYAYLRRFLPLFSVPVVGMLLGAAIVLIFKSKQKNIANLLSVMERNASEILWLMNDDFNKSAVEIGGRRFESVIITPLLMDFWAKVPAIRQIGYQFQPKSILPQVLDVFNGIAEFQWGTRISDGNPPRVLSPFPFMGINTKHFYLGVAKPGEKRTSLEKTLNKYFGDRSKNETLEQNRERAFFNRGTFKGDIEDLGWRQFAGIKVYPPLDFDPWPVGISEELAKVRCLYKFCEEKGIPITSHCSPGGYKVADDAEKLAHPSKWAPVLAEFPNLKLNLAHMGERLETRAYAFGGTIGIKKFPIWLWGNWTEDIIDLVEKYPNVYTDMAYAGYEVCSNSFYEALRVIIARRPKLGDRLMYGSDFSINLQDSKGYREYLDVFLKTPHLTDEQKVKMVNENPERFLWVNS
ncbi:MAG: amidohydrolase [Nitrospinae bacterium]|nr:amidohydrolase [Nitrospinota bacterium]